MGLAEYLSSQFLVQEPEYKWLMGHLGVLDAQPERLADFGCGDGRETLALMLLLPAIEAAGVDRDSGSIRSARDTLRNIENIVLAEHELADLPGFLRQVPISDVAFHQADMTEGTPLQPEYYDLAFCDFVLYHIWLDQGGAGNVKKAIAEMARVVRPGGLVAAREPTQRPGQWTVRMDFGPLFESTDLRPEYVKPTRLDAGEDTHYIYSKPDSA